MAGLKVKDGYTGAAAAVSLGLGLMKKCKAGTWAELTQAMAECRPEVLKVFKSLELGQQQLQLLNDHQSVLALVSLNPTVVPAICPECGYFTLTSDQKPTKCLVSSDCTGKPFKVVSATAAPSIPEGDTAALPPEDPAPEAPAAPEAEQVPEAEPAVEPEPAAAPAEAVPEPVAPQQPQADDLEAVPVLDMEDFGEDAEFVDEAF